MTDFNNTTLFNKYLVIRQLGQGSFSSVYLVRHLSLDQERAVKIIPQDQFDSDSTLFEARLLKSLNHPGIPGIYDIEKDESFYYIVEEYIQGDSLDKFLFHQPIISTGLFFTICRQLCDIFSYLHNVQPGPVIYRDLKPEHIIVCGDCIKLIDFGISSYVSINGNNFNSMGNLSFSAPECFSGNEATLASDIFSIGRIIKYMSEHLATEPSPGLQQIIQKSTSLDPASRYETVDQLSQALEKANNYSCGEHLINSIAVVGSHSGCGATHIAFSIVSFLNYQGYSAVYVENDETGNLQSVPEYDSDFYEKNGWIFCRLFAGIPHFGPGIKRVLPNDRTLVFDYGSNYSDDIKNADIVLLVCGGSVWQQKSISQTYHQLHDKGIKPTIVANLCSKRQCQNLARLMDKRVFCYPWEQDPFYISKDKKRLFKQLLFKKGVSVSFFKRRKRR